MRSGVKPDLVQPKLGCCKKLATSVFVSVQASQMLGLRRELFVNLPLQCGDYSSWSPTGSKIA